MLTSDVTGDLPEQIRNNSGLYEGNVIHYFKTVFFKASNLNNPYHNLRHMLHVFWLCHKACQYYRDRLTPRQMRNLLISALFHDFDHTADPHPEKDADRINIELAVAGLRRCIAPGDRASLPDIEALIGLTQYPYTTGSDELELPGKILRDADLAQAFSNVWVQQVVIGLAREWGTQPIEVLRMQKSFLGSLAFHTEWARELFPRALVDAKIAEAEELLRLLEAEPED